jgi:K+/H+ antiporter YhaU regulatory subunit KhtT
VVVAVERDGKVMLNLAPEFRVRSDDVVIVCGTVTSVDLYLREYKAALWRGAGSA